jgi:hypothetical protein
MIAEAPNAPICTANATALRKRQMREARVLEKLAHDRPPVPFTCWESRYAFTRAITRSRFFA